MSDRELLELAAKAAGLRVAFSEPGECLILGPGDNGRERYEAIWSPLLDDGEALRLAVALRLGVNITSGPAFTEIKFFGNTGMPYIAEVHDSDPYAATRRAIVRAAAEIGKQA